MENKTIPEIDTLCEYLELRAEARELCDECDTAGILGRIGPMIADTLAHCERATETAHRTLAVRGGKVVSL